MKVSNMTSTNGNAVPNQFVIVGCPAGTFTLAAAQPPFGNGYERLGSGDLFQSYETNIAYRDYHGKVYLDENSWDYSRTTSRYRNQFLNMTTKEILTDIKDGVIRLVNLN